MPMLKARIKRMMTRVLARGGVQLIPVSQSLHARSGLRRQASLLDAMAISEPVIFDVGAYDGETTAAYLEAFPTCRVHSFEPYSASFRLLQDRVGGEERVTLHNIAIGAASGPVVLHVNGFTATNSTLPRPSQGPKYYPEQAEETGTEVVQCRRLDDVLAGSACPDILKMDIQGGEHAALLGAVEALRSTSIAVLVLEVMFIAHYDRQPLFSDIDGMLRSFGYGLFSFFGSVVDANGQLRFTNAIFISPPARAAVEAARRRHRRAAG